MLHTSTRFLVGIRVRVCMGGGGERGGTNQKSLSCYYTGLTLLYSNLVCFVSSLFNMYTICK